MKTSTKAAIGGLGAAVVAAAVALAPSKPAPHPMKYRADEFGRVVKESDAGVLIGRESPCFREARNDPDCRELLQRYPDGGQ
jgi:hypothetical protein